MRSIRFYKEKAMTGHKVLVGAILAFVSVTAGCCHHQLCRPSCASPVASRPSCCPPPAPCCNGTPAVAGTVAPAAPVPVQTYSSPAVSFAAPSPAVGCN
jgi:hypothetical protein